MPDWDEDSERLRENLLGAYRLSRDSARKRAVPGVAQAREWHKVIMQDLSVPDEAVVGRFRGEAGLHGFKVRVGLHDGVLSGDVTAELAGFERKLRSAVNALDKLIAKGKPPQTADAINAVIELCAWAHAEWVRIHPFANGNGRTARLWAAFVAMRYGVPPFVRLRPRPDGGYGAACGKAMEGDWKPMVTVFRQMYLETLRDLSSGTPER